MERKICLDTDILIDFLRNKEYAVTFLREHEKAALLTTHINAFELYQGAFLSDRQENNVKKVEELLDRLLILNLTRESVKTAGSLFASLKKEGMPIEIRDLFIGTIALSDQCALKTNNKKHFERIRGLTII